MKRLFFTALMAVVAVGGACAQEYSTGPFGTGTPFDCTGVVNPLCSSSESGAYIYGTNTWTSPLEDETIVLY